MTDITTAEVEDRLLGAFDIARRAKGAEGKIDRAIAARFAEAPDPDGAPDDPLGVLDGLNVLDDEDSEPAWQNRFGSGYRFFFRKGANAEKTQIDDLCKEMLRRAADDFAMWTAICANREALADNEPVPANVERAADESFAWIVQPEADDKVEAARRATLRWLRSGLAQRDFCRKAATSRTRLRRAIDLYCETLADRLSNAPPRRGVGRRNNDHMFRRSDFNPRGSIPFIWHAPLPATNRLDEGKPNPDIAVGLDAIAAGIKRRPSTTLRLIEGGHLPVAKIGGEHVASLTVCRAAMRKPASARIAA